MTPVKCAGSQAFVHYDTVVLLDTHAHVAVMCMMQVIQWSTLHPSAGPHTLTD